MAQDVPHTIPTQRLLLCAVSLGLNLVFGPPAANAGEAITLPGQQHPQTQHEHAAQPPASSAGMKAHIDPDTGQFKNPPPGVPPAKLPPEHADAFSTSSHGLSQRPSPTPGGGMMVDLKNRFLSPLTATLSPEGKLTIRHQPSRTPATPVKE